MTPISDVGDCRRVPGSGSLAGTVVRAERVRLLSSRARFEGDWSALDYACLVVFILSLILIDVLSGGTWLAHAIPSYGAIALVALLTVFSKRTTDGSAAIPCLITTGLFIGYVLLRTIFSPVEYLARPDLFMVIAVLIVYLLTGLYFTTRQRRIWVIGALMLVAAVHVGIGLVQFKNGRNFMPLSFLQRPDYGSRASGFYICPNHLAGFLEVVVMLGLGLTCWSRLRPWLKMVFGYFSLIALFGLLITGSRGGYLSTIFGLLVFGILSLAVLRRRARKIPWRLSAAGVVIAVILAGVAGGFIMRNEYLRSRTETIYEPENIRMRLWPGAIRQFGQNPTFGTGSRTYLYYGRFFRPSDIDRDPEFPHNDYLQLLAEFGVIGAGLFLLFLPTHIWTGFKSFQGLTQRDSSTSITSNSLALNIGALSAVATYVIHSIFDFNLHIPGNALLLAFVFGILASPSGKRSSVPARKTSRFGWYGRLALPALGVWLAIAALPTLPAEYYAQRAQLAVTDEHYPDAIKYATEAIRWDKTNYDAFRYLGWAQTELADNPSQESERDGLHRDALVSFTKAVALFPQDRWLLLEMGWALDGLQQFDQADGYFRKAIAWDPNSAQVRFYYGAHLEAAGKVNAAEEMFRKSLQLHPNVGAEMGLERIREKRETNLKEQSLPPQK
jgi:O-antigen ligase